MRNNFKPNAILILDTGDFFYGSSPYSFCAKPAEVCFTTSMTGYQEVISDPSYANQYVVFSFPHVGNVGVNPEDNESKKPLLEGVIMGEDITHPSSYRSHQALASWLKEKNIPCITDIDTRSLIKIISRSPNPIRAEIIACDSYLTQEEINAAHQKILKGQFLKGQFLSKSAVDLQPYCVRQNDPKWHEYESSQPGCQKDFSDLKNVAVIDYGIKANIVRALNARGFQVTVYPFDTPVDHILQKKPDGLVLSNGPGDPMASDSHVIESVKSFLEQPCPILAICFGYQLIARALGAETVQMLCGHHGTNHPVKDFVTGRILITSQNHEFVLNESTINDKLEITHRSLFDDTLEGFKVRGKNIFAYQFHPEACPGPNDAKYLFDEYSELVENYAKKTRH